MIWPMRDATISVVRVPQRSSPPAEDQVRKAERWICADHTRSSKSVNQ